MGSSGSRSKAKTSGHSQTRPVGFISAQLFLPVQPHLAACTKLVQAKEQPARLPVWLRWLRSFPFPGAAAFRRRKRRRDAKEGAGTNHGQLVASASFL
ncbi:hypothetical protein IAQ61_000684 [Plenodomus lingam]|uniref:uncharacterized protein n=1 Tax=Leptosphaeria maculans TaxID=5022 RepID=UPI003332438A|nr:hypothetical protein IAQ61_000684 [Plenodomus lingam]